MCRRSDYKQATEIRHLKSALRMCAISAVNPGVASAVEVSCVKFPVKAGYFFRGTLAPFLRASESPIAIACLRLVTRPPLPPLPERSVPRFSRCIALFTLFAAAFPYRAICFLLVAESIANSDHTQAILLPCAAKRNTSNLACGRRMNCTRHLRRQFPNPAGVYLD